MFRYLLQSLFLLGLCCCTEVITSDGCPTGWFGINCQYKCHCNGTCNDGECQNQCEYGWFGLNCQYQDLVTYIPATVIPRSAFVSLTDNDVSTCIHYTAVTVDLKGVYPVKWMRMVVKNPELIYNLTIHFQSDANVHREYTIQKEDIVIRGHTVDVHLKIKYLVQFITLEGGVIQNLCLLRISGGRNVALKQLTSQTSTYGNYERHVSSKAVDGIIQEHDNTHSCTNTNSGDGSPSWTLTFQPVRWVNRIVIYRKEASIRLKKFWLQIFNEYNRNIFRHTESISLAQHAHTILPQSNSSTKTITIIASTQREGLYLALCEVEAYEECPSGMWGLECNNTCLSNCPDICRFDDGTCTDVCFGFENPPECNITCSPDKWGENCKETCHRNCHNSICNSQTGQCEHGCQPGYQMPDCKENCNQGKWGENCENVCSSNCYLKEYCDKGTGECLYGCESGYSPPLCDTRCNKGFYGLNCSKMCAPNCLNSRCHDISGYCANCTGGFTGLLCDVEEPSIYSTSINYPKRTESKSHNTLYIGISSLAGFFGFIIFTSGMYLTLRHIFKKHLSYQTQVSNAGINLYANIHMHEEAHELRTNIGRNTDYRNQKETVYDMVEMF